VKKLYKLILQSFAGPFFLTFFIVIFLLLMQFIWKYIDDLAGKGLGFDVLGELMFYVAASLIPLALPLAVLLASLMTMGNLGENYELTAMKASGISLPKIVAPLVVLSFFLTIGAFLFANYVLPITNLKMGALLHDITQQKPELQIREGIFYNGIDDYSIRINKKNYKTNMLYGIQIYNHTNTYGNTYVTLADSGKIQITPDKKYLKITLFDGHSYEDVSDQNNYRNIQKKNYPFRRDIFKKQLIIKELVNFGLNRTDENLFRQNYRMLSLRQLRHQADSLQIKLNNQTTDLYNNIMYSLILRYRPVSFVEASVPRPNMNKIINAPNKKPNNIIRTDPGSDTIMDSMELHEQVSAITEAVSFARDVKIQISINDKSIDEMARLIRKHDIEWWKKYTLSVSCIIFFFIGAPLGAIIRKGGLGMPVVISVLFFVLWYVLSLTSEKFVREGIAPSAIGMWSTSVILMALGIFLTRKATLESSIFNVETYLNPIKKFMNKYSPKKLKFKNIRQND
jgi:lipopolysaccharide export system permease protein